MGIYRTILSTGLALAIAAPFGAAQANKIEVLYNFIGADTGIIPNNLIRDHDGNIYGTTYAGGRKDNRDLGTVFSLAADGTYTKLYAFKAKLSDGKYPIGGVVRDKAGNLYGTTEYGGKDYDVCYQTGCGTIFKLAPDGSETVLHAFRGSDGAGGIGDGSPLLDRNGNLYGATWSGGNAGCVDNLGCGVVFKLSPEGKLKVLHAFDGSDGGNPAGTLIADSDGNLYGAGANYGGTGCGGAGCGVIFKVAPDGTTTVLHSFAGTDGSVPYGPLVRDADGNLYGTTVGGDSGNCEDGCGVAFKLAPDGTLTVLHEFENGSDGAYPEGGLIADGSGNLYGITVDGGLQDCQSGCGVVFKLTPNGTQTILYSFDNGSAGFHPAEGLTIDGGGNLYGVTWEGGAYGLGTIFKIKN